MPVFDAVCALLGEGSEKLLCSLGAKQGSLYLVGGSARTWNLCQNLVGVKDVDLMRTCGPYPVLKDLLTPHLFLLDEMSSMNRFGGLKLRVNGVVVDLWDGHLVDYLSAAPLAGDGIATRLLDGFTMLTREFVVLPASTVIQDRPTNRHTDQQAWAEHVEHVLKFDPVVTT